MPDNPKKILIAEDNVALSDAYKERLISLGFSVVEARSGDQVLEMAKTEMPDLILLELVLPKKSGFEVLGELRANEAFKKIPIFIISDEGSDADIKKALQLGASLFFIKTKSRLIDIVQNIEGILQ